MRLKEPRILPMEENEWSDEVRERMERMNRDGDVLNIFKTLAHHPKLFKRWLVFSNHVLFKSSLPARDREILILRIGWVCRSEYEWTQHVAIGKECGLTDADIRKISEGPEAEGIEAFDALLLEAVDELHEDAMIKQETWDKLSQRYNREQLIDIIFTVGQYNLVSMALNSLGVQLEPAMQRPPLVP
jgi:4-carboxymuconolactone decarboxylase